MARPRKYATAAEAAHVRKLQERDRKRRSRVSEHAKKADPTKRKDAFVNAKNWPEASITDETMGVIARFVREIGANRFPGLRMRSAALLMSDWEEANRRRLPRFISTDGNTSLDAASVAVAEDWNKVAAILRYTLEIILPRENKRLRKEAKECEDAERAGITVAELRKRKDVAANLKWEREQAAAGLREKGERLLAKRAQQEAAKLAEHANYGRF